MEVLNFARKLQQTEMKMAEQIFCSLKSESRINQEWFKNELKICLLFYWCEEFLEETVTATTGAMEILRI